MKTIYSFLLLFLFTLMSYVNPLVCPDPPENDDPCIMSVNPPFQLEAGIAHIGTTCCARGPEDMNMDGSSADFASLDCSLESGEAAVWYMYQPSAGDDGYAITLATADSLGSAGLLSVEVYSGIEDAGCTDGFSSTLASLCDVSDTTLLLANCLDTLQRIFIKVSTAGDMSQCGTFSLTLNPASHCEPMADNCFEVTDNTTFMVYLPNPFGDGFTCVNGCLGLACPEDTAYGGCPEFTEMPTVWYKMNIESGASQLYTTVEAMGDWTPIWSIFVGPDCNNLSVVAEADTPPCSNGDLTPELHQSSIFDSDSVYWMMVTVDPESIPPGGIGDGSFEICAGALQSALICLGEEEGGVCTDESLVIEVTEREYEDLPLDGPFMPGEEVTIHISFLYDANNSGADWLMGMVPMFGEGWDVENFDFAANPPTGSGQTAEWYEEGGDCAPILQENIPILCTYTDEDGNLQLCNIICSACFECETQGMDAGDPLPSGYFWVTTGGNAGCENDCSPGEGWGIGQDSALIEWVFTMRVKEFEDDLDCLDHVDLSIGFQTFSDGTAGCWEDPVAECLLDRSMMGPFWKVECVTTSVVDPGPPSEISISPNPSEDKFLVNYDFDGPMDYVLQTPNGHVVKRGSIADSSSAISWDNLSSGLYIISFSKKGEKWTAIQKITRM